MLYVVGGDVAGGRRVGICSVTGAVAAAGVSIRVSDLIQCSHSRQAAAAASRRMVTDSSVVGHLTLTFLVVLHSAAAYSMMAQTSAGWRRRGVFVTLSVVTWAHSTYLSRYQKRDIRTWCIPGALLFCVLCARRTLSATEPSIQYSNVATTLR